MNRLSAGSDYQIPEALFVVPDSRLDFVTESRS